MTPDTILDGLGVCSGWSHRRDGSWGEFKGLDPRVMTRLLSKAGARWITMTVTPAGDGFRLIYHWDLDGQLLNIATVIDGGRVDSIADLLPAAEWVEREVHDYYALEFLGRDETPALMLRPGDEPGLFSRTRDLGRDGDPAEYDEARAGETGETASGETGGATVAEHVEESS